MPKSALPSGRAERDLGPLRPAERQAHRLLHRLGRRRQRHAFVELHADVGVEQRLDLQRPLRRQPVGRSVDVRLERDAVLVELTEFRQRHHLEAAAVGQDRSIPTCKFVQAAERRHAFGARAQHQVIGVAENDVGARRLHLGHGHCLHRAGGADRHEGGRADDAARQRDRAGAGRAVGRVDAEGEPAHRACSG